MKEQINYPVKYAVLELKEKGGWTEGYQDITQGFIVSKCFVVESNVIYNKDGSEKLIHKVVFPFDNLYSFEQSLKSGIHDVGLKTTPSYDVYYNPYPVTIVDDLYDLYEDAKEVAKEKNEDFKVNLINKISISNPNWEYQYELLKQDFDKKVLICELYEQIVTEKTNDMRITNENENSYVRVLKKPKENK